VTGHSTSYSYTSPLAAAAAWQAGEFVVLTTVQPSSPGVVRSHAYAMVGYSATTSSPSPYGSPFEFYNPWGLVQSGHAGVYGLFHASAPFVSQNFAWEWFGN
jgi:hypothetical protein